MHFAKLPEDLRVEALASLNLISNKRVESLTGKVVKLQNMRLQRLQNLFKQRKAVAILLQNFTAILPVAPSNDEIQTVIAEKKILLERLTAQIKQLVSDADIGGALAVVELNCTEEDDESDPTLASLKGILTQF